MNVQRPYETSTTSCEIYHGAREIFFQIGPKNDFMDTLKVFMGSVKFLMKWTIFVAYGTPYG